MAHVPRFMTAIRFICRSKSHLLQKRVEGFYILETDHIHVKAGLHRPASKTP